MEKHSFCHINFKFFVRNFIIIFFFNHYLVLAQTDTSKYPTGFREPTKEEIDWQKKNLINTVKVFPNEIALRRVQNSSGEVTRAKKTYFPAVNLKPIGEEMVGYTGEDSLALSAVAKGLEQSDYLLPSAVDNTELPFFPGIGNQGSLGSCDEFSKVYYTLTHVTGLLRNWSSVEKIFSPAWLYNHTLYSGGASQSGHGGFINFLFYHGCATMDEFFYDGFEYKKWCTDANIWRNALSMRLSSCGKISYISPDNATAFNNLRQMLANGYILNFHTLISNWQYTTVKDNINTIEDNKFIGENACNSVSGSPDIAGHAMTIVGYNDSLWIDINGNNVMDEGELGAFKIANSWGVYWGNKGYMWFAYDALKQYSTIPGAPSVNRLTGWRDNSEVYWLLPSKYDYKPVLLSEITIHQAKRAQIKLWLGVSDISVSIPQYTWYPGILQNAGREYASDGTPLDYAFDGTTIPCDGSFTLDYTDLIAENHVDTSKILRWYIGIEDNTINDPTTIRSFKLIDMFNGETELTHNTLPVLVDNSIKYVFTDYKIGSKANKAPVIDIGKDTVIFHKDTLKVTAIVNDDYLSKNRILKYNWEILLKNNNATLINSNSINCKVIFEEPGEYVLRCTVDDGEVKTSDDKTIYVSNLDLLSQIIHGGIGSGNIHYSGDYLIVGNYYDLYILNIKDKTNPVILSNYKTPWAISNIDATEKYAYVSLGAYGLTILDITNKSFPNYVNNYNGNIPDAKIKDNYAYLLEDTKDELIVLNVTNQNNLLKIASLVLPGISSSSRLEISDNFIYISDPFSLIDISDIYNPKIVYSNTTFTGSTLNVLGEYVFIDNMILNIKNPQNPVLISNFNIKGKCEFIQGNCAYISSDEGISVYNISNKRYPQQIGYYPTNFITGDLYHDGYDGNHHDMYADKNYIYVVNQDPPGVQIFKADLINTKPYIYIYSDNIFADTAQVMMQGIATDDGTPVNSVLRVCWSGIFTPGPVEFEDSTQVNTKISFYRNGRYVFKLNASDGELSNSDTVMVYLNMPVSIEKQSKSLTRCAGENAFFVVKAFSNKEVRYSWLKNGTPLSENERHHGVKSDSLVINNISADDYGEYSCLISVDQFALESTKATLIINDLPKIDLGNDKTIDTNAIETLDAGSGYTHYAWSNGSLEQKITISDLIVGDYKYSVRVTDNKNCSNSDTITIHVNQATSISRLLNSFRFKIFPNPTSGILFIRSDADIKTALIIKIIDGSGRVVFNNKFDNFEADMGITLNLTNLKNGIYILRINNSDIVKIQKIIKY
jgi:hypothetical protein